MRTLLLLAALAFAPAAHAQSLESLNWLKGCWRSQTESSNLVEVWSAPPLPALLGYSYTIADGEVQGWEQTRIELIDGVPHFVAMPMGSDPARFPLEAASETSVTFANAAHDYPQRISYTRTGNRLVAQISRLDGVDTINFEYRRISCSAAMRP
jgi:hypothetical protein